MRPHLIAATLALILPCLARAQSPRPADPASSGSWWAHVTALADDSMLGREAGSPQHRTAAEYVASAFARASSGVRRSRVFPSSS